ncbi:Protein kinase [Quillaja saponaria]|uniref:non-specific serine/threonine protein kinase n=1 Tax=Quillaja saponaria TaxID=32244 RepID=A0AAD7PU68_QUISA|nr:Protein kinase [Quillaja saponaria]
MGICYGIPVNNHSPGTTKPSTPSVTETSNGNGIGSSISSTTTTGAACNNNVAGRIVTPNLKMFTLDELKSATRNFRANAMIGEGGFGKVFKGWVEENTYKPSTKTGLGRAVAVKKSNPNSDQGLREWQSEVKFLGKFCHPNLVTLLGYCWDHAQFLLVYEFMQRGSLENHLFRNGPEPLSWDTRLKIAMGAARGLSFLHTCEKSVIYRDFKPSNILLDEAFNAKLSDFGLAKFGPNSGISHVTTRVMGTHGYAAPEYIATGHLYVKSDVYGFGVVLLEMLTGLRALDSNRPAGKQNLVGWAKPSLTGKKKQIRKIMDPRMGEHYPIEGAMEAARLICNCLESDPKYRPSMQEVLDTLVKINDIKTRQERRPNSRNKSQN